MAIKIRKKKSPGEAPETDGVVSEGGELVTTDDMGLTTVEGGSAAAGDQAPANPLEQEELAEPDRFVEASVGLTGWVQEHWKLVVAIASVATLGVVGYLIWDHLGETREIEQSSALHQAILTSTTPTQADVDAIRLERQRLVMQAQLSGQQLPPDFDLEAFAAVNFSQVYPDDQARSQAVLDATQSALSQYPDAAIADEAKLLGAAASLRLGKPGEAASMASEAAGSLQGNADIFARQVRASALAAEGKTDEAVTVYREILEASPKYYGPFALMQIGVLQEQAGNTESAADAYAELVGRFPEAGEVEVARRRVGLLVDDADDRIKQATPE